MSINLKQYRTMGSLRSFLSAILFGLAFLSLITGGVMATLFIAILSIVILALRHTADWIPYALGVIVGVVLGLLLPQLAWTEQALLAVFLGAMFI